MEGWLTHLANKYLLELPDSRPLVWKGSTNDSPLPGMTSVIPVRHLGSLKDKNILLRIFRPHAKISHLLTNQLGEVPSIIHNKNNSIVRCLFNDDYFRLPRWCNDVSESEFRFARREITGPLLISEINSPNPSSWNMMKIFQHSIFPFGKEILVASLLEDCGQTVLELDLQGALNLSQKEKIINSVADFLKVLHKPNTSSPSLVFQDLKPCNICCHSLDPLQVKIIDFGAVIPAGAPGLERFATFGFHGPETLNPTLPIWPHSDIFSFGCLVFWLFSSGAEAKDRLPYPMDNEGAWDFSKTPPIQDLPISKTLKHLLRQCLNPIPDRRPTNGNSLCELMS